MALSKQFKHSMYKRAYELIDIGFHKQMCIALARAVYSNPWYYPHIDKKKFPELFLFEPDNHSAEEWFDIYDKKTRLIILLFCIEMTRP